MQNLARGDIRSGQSASLELFDQFRFLSLKLSPELYPPTPLSPHQRYPLSLFPVFPFFPHSLSALPLSSVRSTRSFSVFHKKTFRADCFDIREENHGDRSPDTQNSSQPPKNEAGVVGCTGYCLEK